MIISEQKNINNILENLKENNIFIIGCGKCATKLNVGGEAQVKEMQDKLKSSGKNIVGWCVINTACSSYSVQDSIFKHPDIKTSDAILVMSCSCGVSIISKFLDVPVYPALNTISIGGIYEDMIIKEQCSLCGKCNIWIFGGICPISNCAKGLTNGPCGGSINGNCEIDGHLCVWDSIFEKLKKTGKLEYLELIVEP